MTNDEVIISLSITPTWSILKEVRQKTEDLMKKKNADTDTIDSTIMCATELVENAIKYGMKTSDMPLRIIISAKVENKWLIIQVSNSGKLIDGEKNTDHGTGTGLTNVKHRLEYSCPHKNKFEIFEEDGMVKAIIKILKEFR